MRQVTLSPASDEDLLNDFAFMTAPRQSGCVTGKEHFKAPQEIELKQKDFSKSRLVQQTALGLVQALKKIHMCKSMGQSSFLHKYPRDPVAIYNQFVTSSLEITLPLIAKIFDKKLVLQDYTLDTGHLMALNEAIRKSEVVEIQQVAFDNCGIDDQELGVLL